MVQALSAPSQAQVADAVDTATGSFSETTTDMSIPGAGVPLQFAPRYSTQLAQAQLAAGSTFPAPSAMGGIGYGWSDNLSFNLAFNAATHTVTVTEPSGAETSYVSGSSQPWCASEPAGPAGSTLFCPSAPRVEADVYELQNNAGWELADDVSGNLVYGFTPSGTLQSITNTAGASIASGSYTPGTGQAPCPSGDSCTAWTSSASGRELVLATASGQLQQVFSASGGNPMVFSYTGSGCPTDLCSVEEPDQGVTSFTYDWTNTNSDYVDDVLTETEPSGRTLQNTYDADGSGRVSSQQDPSGVVTSLTYSAAASAYQTVPGATTTVTVTPYSGGQPQSTVYDYSSGVLTGETAGSGSSVASTTSYYRDSASLAPYSKVDGNGNATSYSLAGYLTDSATGVADVTTSADAVGNVTETGYIQPTASSPSANLVYCTVAPADYLKGVTCPSTPPTAPPAHGYASSSTPAAICAGSSPPPWCSYLGATITYYDAAGNPTAVTNADGYTSITAYTGTGLGVPAELAYCQVDAAEYSVANVACPSYNDTASGATTTTFNAEGDVVTQTNPTGGETSYTYGDSAFPWLPTTVTDPDGNVPTSKDVTTNTYTNAGQLTDKVARSGRPGVRQHSGLVAWGWAGRCRGRCRAGAAGTGWLAAGWRYGRGRQSSPRWARTPAAPGLGAADPVE